MLNCLFLFEYVPLFSPCRDVILWQNNEIYIQLAVVSIEWPDLLENLRATSWVSKLVLVCQQTYSHTVMCKVCLTASNTVFGADAFVRLNHWILSNIWRVRFLVVPPHLNSPNILLNLQYNLLAIHLSGFSANLRTRELRLMSSLYKDTIR